MGGLPEEKGFFYSVNVQIEGRAAFGASRSNAGLGCLLLAKQLNAIFFRFLEPDPK